MSSYFWKRFWFAAIASSCAIGLTVFAVWVIYKDAIALDGSAVLFKWSAGTISLQFTLTSLLAGIATGLAWRIERLTGGGQPGSFVVSANMLFGTLAVIVFMFLYYPGTHALGISSDMNAMALMVSIVSIHTAFFHVIMKDFANEARDGAAYLTLVVVICVIVLAVAFLGPSIFQADAPLLEH